MDEVVADLRACLLSSKGGIRLSRIDKDYLDVVGEHIPYRRLKFSSLDEFLSSIPVLRRSVRFGEVFFEAIPSEKTAHIADLVQKQKTDKKARKTNAYLKNRPLRTPHSNQINRTKWQFGGNQFNSNSASGNYQRKPSYSSNMRNTPSPNTDSSFRFTTENVRRQLNPTSNGRFTQAESTKKPLSPPSNGRFSVSENARSTHSPIRFTTSNGRSPESDNSRKAPSPIRGSTSNGRSSESDNTKRSHSPIRFPSPNHKSSVSENTKRSHSPIRFPTPNDKSSVSENTKRSHSPIRFPTPNDKSSVSENTKRPHSPIRFPSPNDKFSSADNARKLASSTSNGRSPPLEKAGARNAPTRSSQNTTTQQVREVPKAKSSLQDRLIIRPTTVIHHQNPNLSPPFEEPIPSQNPVKEEKLCQSAFVSSIIPFEDFTKKTPIEELEILARNLGFHPPIYKISKAKNYMVYASVSVGDESYSSYPEAIKSEYDAKTLAATRAVEKLKTETQSIATPITENKSSISERILKIIDSHPTGVFSTQIQNYYTTEYHELLPQDWFQIIKECSKIETEQGVDNTIILTRRTNIQHSPVQQETYNPQLSPFSKMKAHPYIRHSPGELQVPDDIYWPTYVTVVYGTDEVWLRIVGKEYSDRFSDMTTVMSKFYDENSSSTKASEVQIGAFYTMCVDETWYRVKCLEIDSTTGEATVYFIDHGDDQPCHVNMLHEITKEFCELPAQALRVSLNDLEEFSDFEEANLVVEKHLLEQTRFIEVKSVDDNRVFSVVFYDTGSDIDINLNKKMASEIIDVCVPKPEVESEGRIHEVFVSEISQNGEVYIQLKGASLIYLTNLMNKFIEEKLSQDLTKFEVTKVNIIKIYIIKSLEDGFWYRVRVLNVNYNTGEVDLLTVDFGKTLTAKMSSLLDLETMSEILSVFPPQAILVHLFKIPPSSLNAEKVKKLKQIVPPSQSLLLKVMHKPDSRSPPIVELFKRQEPNNEIISIIVLLGSELKKGSGDDNNNKVRKRSERLLSRYGSIDLDNSVHRKSLKMPKIPDVGESFKVHVTQVSHPGNFIVQPLEDQEALSIMNTKLQYVCNNYKGDPLSFDNIQEKGLYAAQHPSGEWYRVCILQKLKMEMAATVYICDYGEIALINLKKLQPLEGQFFELPYQAIRANLSGIKAMSVDWSVEDCMRFKDLIEKKIMVAVVKKVTSDGGDIVLTLELTNVENNIQIDEILIKERRAQRSNSISLN